ncbi:uncharacterized protein GGS25DRAFT_474018 [Hypoxylon fragiforme]|uniref:uncharacterized protein n=1 Tax=Hypoxylon fragiforme TaxID=63214 RepID=UPI0020C604D3|nr:uncharacterized protein GGS25DRAFT_474018 [Hypoxylon fragiforme]KAI2612158.1 hypothetical protein GGS25DRAFT_474018 [Hypoxylon fragiforme]
MAYNMRTWYYLQPLKFVSYFLFHMQLQLHVFFFTEHRRRHYYLTLTPPINPLFLSFYFSPKNKQFPPNHTLTMSTPNVNNEYMPVFPSSNAAAVLDERVRKFIADFYATSDDKARNEEWVACFAPDAVVVMGERRARGREEIRRLREGMWEHITRRKHRPAKVFPASFGEGAGGGDGVVAEYMLYGSLDAVTKKKEGEGETMTMEWAGRAVLREVKEEGRLCFGFYQVYLHRKTT